MVVVEKGRRGEELGAGVVGVEVEAEVVVEVEVEVEVEVVAGSVLVVGVVEVVVGGMGSHTGPW
jgi:hypothetical protein